MVLTCQPRDRGPADTQRVAEWPRCPGDTPGHALCPHMSYPAVLLEPAAHHRPTGRLGRGSRVGLRMVGARRDPEGHVPPEFQSWRSLHVVSAPSWEWWNLLRLGVAGGSDRLGLIGGSGERLGDSGHSASLTCLPLSLSPSKPGPGRAGADVGPWSRNL